jgi:hypothetical protein
MAKISEAIQQPEKVKPRSSRRFPKKNADFRCI